MTKSPGAGYQRDVVLIYGQTGSGKSVLARAVSQRIARARSCPVVVIDTLDEYTDLPAIDPDSVKAWTIAGRGRAPSPDAWLDSCRVLCPAEPELEATFQGLFDAHDEKPGPSVVLVDEVSYWTKPNYTAPGLRDAIRYGRHREVSLVTVARRPAETARELSGQATELRLFKVVERRDLEYLAGVVPPEVTTKLPSMDRFCSLTYRFDGSYTISPPVQIIVIGQKPGGMV